MSDKRDPFDGEYIGTIFSSKVMTYGALFILFLVGVIVYRHWALDVPFGIEEPVIIHPLQAKDTLFQESVDTFKVN